MIFISRQFPRGKVAALNRWSGKQKKYLSMGCSFSNKCAKNLCKWTILVQLIIETVVTCFWNTPYYELNVL